MIFELKTCVKTKLLKNKTILSLRLTVEPKCHFLNLFIYYSKRKVWQGQAFETMEGSVNSLPISPTPCLKIRHMFDSDV